MDSTYVIAGGAVALVVVINIVGSHTGSRPMSDTTSSEPTSSKPWWVLPLVAVVAFLWWQGTFDRALFDVGLNAKPCVTNGFGAKFCGDAARDYCMRVRIIAPTADCEAVINR